MTKSRSVSFYLLKENFDHSNALKDEGTLDNAIRARKLPQGAHIFVLDSEPRPPWWKDYFGIEKDLVQGQKGAIVFIPVRNRHFALTLGHVSHNLKDESYEYDFGLKVTLNCVDPKKLKNTDTVEPGSARRRRTQHAIETELSYFDFDYHSSVLKSLTGKVKQEYAEFVKQVTGASNLRVDTKIPAEELNSLCAKFLELYEDESYLQTFPNIRKVAPVRDPIQLTYLNSRLEDAVQNRSDHVHLSVPDIIDYGNTEGLYVSFSGAGRSDIYDDVSILHYYDYLRDRKFEIPSLTIDKLRSHSLQLVNEDGRKVKSYPIYKSLLFDLDMGDGSSLYFNEGNWYEVDSSYAKGLQAQIDSIWSDLEYLPECTFPKEAEYNDSVGKRTGFICLDTTNIAPNGQTQIEPCDLITVQNDHATLIHVKISTGSSLLSHLFNQGSNSVELLKSEDEARVKLAKLLEAKGKPNDEIERLAELVSSNSYQLVFAIISRKNVGPKSLNLPLFSRISLARTVKAVRDLMSIPVSVGFIYDASSSKQGRPKSRRAKNNPGM